MPAEGIYTSAGAAARQHHIYIRSRRRACRQQRAHTSGGSRRVGHASSRLRESHGSMRREREGVGVIIRNSLRPSRHTEATRGPASSGSQTAVQASALRAAERRREHPLSGACRLAKEVCAEKQNRVYRGRASSSDRLVCVCVCVY
jgi:hypothetical protein